MSRAWHCLQSVPQICSIIAKDNNTQTIYSVVRFGELFKYQGSQNIWIRQNNTESDIEWYTNYNVMAINSQQNKIYMYKGNKDVEILTIPQSPSQKNHWNQINDLNIATGQSAEGLIINNQFHVFAGEMNNKHLLLNENTKQWEVIHQFKRKFFNHRVIQTHNKLLLFGGLSWRSPASQNADYYLKQILEFDINLKIWTQSSVSLPRRLSGFGCVSVLNNQYVLFLGGETTYCKSLDSIIIYSIDTQSFRTSMMTCPHRSTFRALSLTNRNQDKIITFGFVRQSWNSCNISDTLFPPKYLINIIINYYWNEWIHLFDCFEGSHWTINVYNIL